MDESCALQESYLVDPNELGYLMFQKKISTEDGSNGNIGKLIVQWNLQFI